MAQFGNDPELHKLVSDENGERLGDNPAFIRFCINIGKAMGEAPFFGSRSTNPNPVPVNPLLALAQTYKN
jgi:hypothetical protein